MVKRRRTGRKKKTNRKQLLTTAPIGRSFGFPRQTRVQLRYVEYVVLSDGVGGLMRTNFFRANSIYDPDATGILGTQPLGRDQWVEFYNHYRVVKSKMTVKYATTSQIANQRPAVIGCYLSDDQTIPADYNSLVESGRGTSVIQSNLNTETRTLSSTYDQSKFFKGQGKNQSQLGAVVGTNPTDQAFFCLYMQSIDQSSLATERSFLVQIDYLVDFSEPKDLARS